MNRREQREQTFILIYEKIFHEDLSIEEISQNAFISKLHQADDFSEKTAESVLGKLLDIDEIITNLSKGWKLERLSKVALSILRLAIYEIKFCDDIPISVSINEAVELAKTYSTKEDAAFVNGLLGSLAKSLEDEK